MPGNPPDTSPWSLTVGTDKWATIVIAVTTTIATSGAGTAVVRRGRNTTISTVTTKSG